MAEKTEDERRSGEETVSAIKKLTEKVSEAGSNTIGSTRKLGDNLNDAFRATFADSPLVSSLVDIGQGFGKDVMGLFGGDKKKEPLTEAEIEAAKQRQAQRDELKSVTQQLEATKNGKFEADKISSSENEQIIDNLQDIKEVWEAGDNAEERREQARREEETLKLQERQNQLLEALAEGKKKDEDDKLGFFGRMKENLTLTFLGVYTFLKTLFSKPGKIFAPLLKGFGKFAKILGPIGAIIGTVIGAFTGFNKATEIFGANATILDKIVSSLAGILSGLTFGLLDIEPMAKGIKAASIFMFDTFKPFIVSIGTFFTGVWDVLSSGFNLLTSLFTGTPSEVDAAWDTFVGAFTGLGDKFVNMFTTLLSGFDDLFAPVIDWISNSITSLTTSIGKVLSDVGNWINDAITGLILMLPGGQYIAKDLGLDVTGYKKREESKDLSGETLYNRLEGNGLDDRLFGSDTLSQDAINKLSVEQNAKLQKYLLSNDKADKNSKIITDLQEQLSKMKKEPKESSSSNIAVNAPTTVNNNNSSYIKPNARTTEWKTANL